jgi:hypothetical protein
MDDEKFASEAILVLMIIGFLIIFIRVLYPEIFG